MKRIVGVLFLLIGSIFAGLLCGTHSEKESISAENSRIYANASLTYSGIDSVLDSADLIKN